MSCCSAVLPGLMAHGSSRASRAQSLVSPPACARECVWRVQIFEGCSVVIPDIVAAVSTCKSCVDHRRICYSGNTADIKGCCSSAYNCIQRTSSIGFCVDPNTVPTHWQGSPLACTSDN